MSRLLNKPVPVVTNPQGAPCWVNGWEVLHVCSQDRQQVGAQQGELRRETWCVKTTGGTIELHLVRETWILIKWAT